jgi:hypothetical protein
MYPAEPESFTPPSSWETLPDFTEPRTTRETLPNRQQLAHANGVSCQEAFMNELSGYVFSSLREGDIALYRGSGNGLTPILLVAAEESSMRSSPNLTPIGRRDPSRLRTITAV